MRVSNSVLITLTAACIPLLPACADPSYWRTAQATMSQCSSLEGAPDCQNGRKVDLVETASTPGADHAGIEDLQARYEQAVGSKDASAYAALFTPDAVIEGPSGTLQGRDEIRRELTQPSTAAGVLDTPHVVTNAVIDVNGLTATGTATWLEMGRSGAGGQPVIRGYGRYEDQYVRVHGRWYITRRKIVAS